MGKIFDCSKCKALLTVLCSYLSSNGDASPEGSTDAEEDSVECERPPKPSIDEGKTPEMSSVTRLVSPRRGDILEGELDITRQPGDKTLLIQQSPSIQHLSGSLCCQSGPAPSLIDCVPTEW